MRASGAQLVAVSGVAVLAIAVGALSAAALQQGNPAMPDGTARPAPTFDFGTDRASSTPSDSAAESTPPADEERFLAIHGDRLWRATAGSCGGEPPVVELSTDRGASWTDVTPPGAEQVLAVSALADIAGEVVAGTGANCAPAVMRTYTSGLEWATYPRALGDTTYLSPVDGETVVRPGDDVTAPCPNAHGVRASRGEIGVVCDGTAYTLFDGAWTGLLRHPIAIDAVAGRIVVAHGSSRCEGVAVTRFDGVEQDELICFRDADASAPAAISMLDNQLALWSGHSIFLD